MADCFDVPVPNEEVSRCGNRTCLVDPFEKLDLAGIDPVRKSKTQTQHQASCAPGRQTA